MAIIPCPNKIDCPGSDFPITNYSSEGPEQVPKFPSIQFPDRWDKMGCLSLCVSEISQNDADLCALAQEAACTPDPPPDPPREFCNTAQTCSCVLQGGAEFFYTTPAGTFCAETQEAADAQAKAYACSNCGVVTTSVILGGLEACTCLGSTYSKRIQFTGTTPTTWLITSGSLPDGLSLDPISGTISGIPTESGVFAFTIRALLASGNYGVRTYSLTVLEITTTALDDYILNQAYTFQLQAVGGSGNYVWKVNQGTLPIGLTLSPTGLISGTPTAAGSTAVQFEVIDTTCEAANQDFFTPMIATSSTGTTYIRTKIGFTAYTGSSGTLYKRVDYSGYAQQTATVYAAISSPYNGAFCAGAKYIYSGYSAIDIYGNFTSNHRKDLYVVCPASPQPRLRDAFGNPTFVNKLLGYCWAPDPNTCPTCSSDVADWTFKENMAVASNYDLPLNIIGAQYSTSVSETSFSTVNPSAGTSVPMILGNYGGTDEEVVNFPAATLSDATNYYVNLYGDMNFTATVSDPFTDADAIAGQNAFTSNSKTSENKPDYKTWNQNNLRYVQSRYTNVDFTLACTNLVSGLSYTVTYDFFRSDGVIAANSYTFVASGTTQTIFGSIPTPPSGKTITLKNVKIAFSN